MSYGVNAPIGFVPEMHLNGSTWNGQFTDYLIQDSYATSLFTGDPVVLALGYLTIASTSAPVLGIFVGCRYVSATGTYVFSPYWPASTATQGSIGAVAQVVDDPTVLFNVQMYSGVSGGAVQANIGNNANFETGTGSTVTGNSGYSLNTPATGNATYNFKIVRLVPVPGNVFGINYNNVFVKINNSPYQGGTGTVGV